MLAFNAVSMDAVAMSGASVPESGSSVSADFSIAYTVRAAVSSDLALAYAVRAQVSADLAVQFAVRAPVSSDLGMQFAVMSQVSSDLAIAYSVDAVVMQSVSADLGISYAVLTSVSRDLAIQFDIEAAEEYVRAPLGTSYCRGALAYPESVKRIGLAEAAISIEAARLAARVDGDELDDDVLTAAVAYTEVAEQLTNRAFVQGSWKAGYRGFDTEMILPKPPLVSVTRIAFYDPDGVLRVLDPQDYFVDVDAEPAVLTPSPGRVWPQTIDRKNAVEVQYVCGYGPTEASVPQTVKQYVKARIQQQFSPVANAKEANFDRLLDGLTVYL